MWKDMGAKKFNEFSFVCWEIFEAANNLLRQKVMKLKLKLKQKMLNSMQEHYFKQTA